MLITHPKAPRTDLALAAARNAPAPAPAPLTPMPMADAARGHAAAASFASQLRQQQAAPPERPATGPITRPHDPPAKEPAPDGAEPEPHEADAAQPKPRTAARVRARGADKPAAPDARASAGRADAGEADAPKRNTDAATPTFDPALAAWLAALHAAPATAAKSPSRTTVTPAMCRAAESSKLASLAPNAAGRSTFPYNMPGRFTSGV